MLVQFSDHGRSRARSLLCLGVTAIVISSLLSACGSKGAAAPPGASGGAEPTPTVLIVYPDSTATTAVATTASVAVPTQVPPEVPTETQSTSNPVPESSATLSITPEELQAFVNDLVANAPGFAEVVIALPDGEVIVDVNGAEPMESASLYKLGIMIELYVERETGVLTFDDGVLMEPGYFTEGEDVFGYADIGSTVDIWTLLHAMITQSSNVAATALLATVGNESINTTLASLGVSNTEIRWMPDPAAEPDWSEPPTEDSGEDGDEPAPDDTPTEEGEPSDEPQPDEEPTEEPSGQNNTVVFVSAKPAQQVDETSSGNDPRADAALNVTTAEDIALLYTLMLRGEIIAPTVSQEMLDLLAQQEINDRIPAYLPSGTVVAHKTGNLDNLIHDAGIIYAPAGPIIVAVFTEDMEEGTAIDLIAQIALAAYQAAS